MFDVCKVIDIALVAELKKQLEAPNAVIRDISLPV
jgi:hypothetical protein